MKEELIRRFFNNECTPEEAEQVADYLKNNPSLLEKHLSREEWSEIKNEKMPDEFWNEVWAQIQQKRKPFAYLVWIKKAAVAAGLIFMIGAGYKYFFSQNQPPVIVAQVKEENQHLVNTMNTSKEIKHVNLPDSSAVLLAPGSVITYNTPFDNDKRDVHLEGEARFIVRKDKTRPFTVFAGGLATTALGTEFTINTKATGNKSISVKLHTGKVVIKQTGNIAKAWKQDIYLDPGEQLEYNTIDLVASVSEIKEDQDNVTVALKQPAKKRKRETADRNGELVFTSSPLTEVITKIERQFGTNIYYDSTEIMSMNFTGTISRNDSLPLVLKVIAQMNELQLTQEDDGFRLSKQ